MTPTTEELTRVGTDGIQRSLYEHYDTMMDVHQDPTGAHMAIQALAARVVALEEVVKAAETCIDAMNATTRLAHAIDDEMEAAEAVGVIMDQNTALATYRAARAKLEEQ